LSFEHLSETDPEVMSFIGDELTRQRNSIELIASENFVSLSVMEAVGSPLTNKYAEGLPGKRYYGGCWAVDEVENLARERVKRLFGAGYANVQPHSGAQANYAAISAFADPGDTIMGMALDNGGHLHARLACQTSPASSYHAISYGLDPTSARIDFDDVEAKVKKYRPVLIIAGASAYTSHHRLRALCPIAHDNGAALMVDMAHIAGLVRHRPSSQPGAPAPTSLTLHDAQDASADRAAGSSSPTPPEVSKRINSAVFPGSQGGSASSTSSLARPWLSARALQPGFVDYTDRHPRSMPRPSVAALESRGLRLVTGGTDNTCSSSTSPLRVTSTGARRRACAREVCIHRQQEHDSREKRSPFVASGIRVGSAAATTRGFGEHECERIGQLIGDGPCSHVDDDANQERTHAEVRASSSRCTRSIPSSIRHRIPTKRSRHQQERHTMAQFEDQRFTIVDHPLVQHTSFRSCATRTRTTRTFVSL